MSRLRELKVSRFDKAVSFSIIATVLLTLFALTGLQFIPRNNIVKYGFILSIIISILSFLKLYLSHKNKKIDLNSHSKNKSKLKKNISLFIIFPIGIFLCYWVSLSYTIPSLINSIVGKENIISDRAIKKRKRGRRSSGPCGDKIIPYSYDGLFFQYCISMDQYETFPEGIVPVRIYLKESILGTTIDWIEPEL